MSKKKTTDAVSILHRRYGEPSAEARAEVEADDNQVLLSDLLEILRAIEARGMRVRVEFQPTDDGRRSHMVNVDAEDSRPLFSGMTQAGAGA